MFESAVIVEGYAAGEGRQAANGVFWAFAEEEGHWVMAGTGGGALDFGGEWRLRGGSWWNI